MIMKYVFRVLVMAGLLVFVFSSKAEEEVCSAFIPENQTLCERVSKSISLEIVEACSAFAWYNQSFCLKHIFEQNVQLTELSYCASLPSENWDDDTIEKWWDEILPKQKRCLLENRREREKEKESAIELACGQVGLKNKISCIKRAHEYNLNPERISVCGGELFDRENEMSCIEKAHKHSLNPERISACGGELFDRENKISCLEKAHELSPEQISICGLSFDGENEMSCIEKLQ